MRHCLIVVAIVLAGATSVAQDASIPKLEQRVTDFTNTLSFVEWKSLEKELKAYEDTTSNQIVLLLVGTTAPIEIEDYANRVFEKNLLGQKEKNNGILVVAAFDDRAVRIEVGYGLEGVLTDAIVRKIIEQEIKPRFRDGQFYGGLVAAIYAMAGAVAGEYTADSRGDSAPAVGGGLLFFVILFIFFVVRPMLSMRRRTGLSSQGHRYYSGWGWPGSFGGGSGGGWSGGGGFGGFSGGGGLSGGGGATGRW